MGGGKAREGGLPVDSGRWRGQSTAGTAAALLPAGCVRRLTAYIIISYESCMGSRSRSRRSSTDDATRRTCHAMPGISRQRFAYFAQKSAKVN